MLPTYFLLNQDLTPNIQQNNNNYYTNSFSLNSVVVLKITKIQVLTQNPLQAHLSTSCETLLQEKLEKEELKDDGDNFSSR